MLQQAQHQVPKTENSLQITFTRSTSKNWLGSNCCVEQLLQHSSSFQCLLRTGSVTANHFMIIRQLFWLISHSWYSTYCRFLYEYSRRHPEFSAQMLLRIGKGYEDLLHKCCKPGAPEDCCSRGVGAVRLHTAYWWIQTYDHTTGLLQALSHSCCDKPAHVTRPHYGKSINRAFTINTCEVISHGQADAGKRDAGKRLRAKVSASPALHWVLQQWQLPSSKHKKHLQLLSQTKTWAL